MSGVRLSAGKLVLDIEPELGGCVSAFRHDGIDLMRPMTVPEGRAPHALHSSMFPMLPFANSLRDNRFEFDTRRYEVVPGIPGSRLHYHGRGWHLPWKVAGANGDQCRLVLGETIETPGYSFSAEQHFVLSPDRLDVTVSVTNRSGHRMPFGIGLHPWFPRHDDARVTFVASQWLREDANSYADGLVPVEPGHDFAAGREPPRSFQNRCYAGWDGRARVDWPSLGLSLVIDAAPVLGNVMFHVPRHDPDVFCLEPQSNRTSAFDGLETGHVPAGVHILAEGEALSGRVSFSVRPSAG